MAPIPHLTTCGSTGHVTLVSCGRGPVVWRRPHGSPSFPPFMVSDNIYRHARRAADGGRRGGRGGGGGGGGARAGASSGQGMVVESPWGYRVLYPQRGSRTASLALVTPQEEVDVRGGGVGEGGHVTARWGFLLPRGPPPVLARRTHATCHHCAGHRIGNPGATAVTGDDDLTSDVAKGTVT